MDSQKASQSLPSRRGRQVQPIQTQLTSEALKSHRPRPAAGHTSVHPSERVPLQPAVKRQSSIKGFKTLFKSIRESGNSENLPPVEESQVAPNVITPVSAQPLSANTQGTSKTETAKSTPATSSASQTQKDKPQRNLSKLPKEKPPRAITSWDPPPLFKAYPQAVKHVSLLAPKLPSDTILRLNGRTSSSSTEESQEGEDEGNDSNKKQRKRDRKESRRVSVSINKSEWSHKIFILVTSGYLLQYTGDGHFDRLPEKMMRLNKDSVAFASDAIPGKHWVVQISQALEDEGIVAPEKPKGFFSRLGLQGASARRATKSFLLVLDNPEDMNSWLVVLRREIEALGGKKYAPEVPLNGKPGQQLQNRPSLKYLTKRDSLRTLNPKTEPEKGTSSTIMPARQENKQENKQQDQKKVGDVPSATSVKRQSMPNRESMDSNSLSTLATTTDLDKLRESSRFSYVSVGTRTIPSSRGSSPGDSPCRSNFAISKRPNLDPCAAFRGTAPVCPALPSSNAGRQSQQSRSPAPLERNTQDTGRTGSPQLPSSPPTSRNSSSPAPNFSVPSFSKRFSMPSSPKLAPPSQDQIPRSQLASPVPGQINSRGTVVSWTSCSDNTQDNATEKVGFQPLSRDGDALSGTSSGGARTNRTPSVRPNSSATGRTRSDRTASHEQSTKSYRSSHPPLSSIALPELSPLVDEFPGTSSTRSRRGSFPYQNSRHAKSSTISAPRSRHSLQAQPQSSARSSPNQSSPSTHVSGFNQAHKYPLYFNPQPQPKTARMSESPASSGTPTSPKEDPKRRSALKTPPDLTFGPPTAPPPDCPLPEVPPIVVSQFQSGRQGSPSLNESPSIRSRRSTGARQSCPSEPRVQPKYDDILYNLDDDSSSEEANALNVF